MIGVKNRRRWAGQNVGDIVELEFDTPRLPVITCISCEQEFVLLSIGKEFASRIGINYHLLHCPFCGKPLSAKLLKKKRVAETQKDEYLCFDLGGYGAYGRQETLNEFAAMRWELVYIGGNWETCWRRKAEMENKKAQFAAPLGVLSRDGDIISPDALNLSTLRSEILDQNGVVMGKITDAAIDGNKLIFTIEHCDEFVEKLKERGTWTITSAVKSSGC